MIQCEHSLVLLTYIQLESESTAIMDSHRLDQPGLDAIPFGTAVSVNDAVRCQKST